MCRSIKPLREQALGHAVTEEEIAEAALQFVRKISGYRKPSQANEAVFDSAVDEVAAASKRLLDGLVYGRTAGR
jgi:hypothetical protein